MTKNDGVSNSTKNGTGHILRDLLSCTVLLNRTNFIPPHHDHNLPQKIEENNSSPESGSCSICSESINLSPLAVQEMEILAKFILSQEQISLILQTEDHSPIFCCKICSSAILSLANLTTQIENITISLRAVISSRNGLFNKLRKESEISELSHEIVANRDSYCSGSIDEEEFSVKVEPIYDDNDDDNRDEITSDPLYEPDMSESDDASSDAANSDVEAESKYTCEICQPKAKFSRYSNYLRHMTNKKIHPDICDDFAISKKTKRLVVPLNQFPCPKCDQSFTSHGAFHRHKSIAHDKVHSQRKCTLCPKVFPHLNLLQRHTRKCHTVPVPSQRGRHSCVMCLKTFSSSGNRNRHVELVHFHDKTSCPYGCETKFGSETEWVTHLEGCDSSKMRAEPQCVCKHCAEVFRNMLLHIEHDLRVHPEKMYSCSICEQRFTRQSVLNDHSCGVTGIISVTNSESKTAESKFVCKICQPNVTFSKHDNLIRHMKNKNIHPGISEDDITASNKFECKKCGIKYASKRSLSRHMNVHSDEVTTSALVSAKAAKRRDRLNRKSVSCPKCDQRFTSYVNLHRHMRSIHDGIKRKCTLCPRIFTRVSILKAHMQQSHNVSRSTKPTRYPCDMCSNIFTTTTSMHRHVELAHFPDKTSCPYGCPIKVGSEVEWVTHLEGCDSPKMSAESEPVCEFCGDVFRNSLLRIEHHLREHRDKCYPCSFCGGIFSRPNALHNHSCKWK